MPAVPVHLGSGAQSLDAGVLEALEGFGELPDVSESLPRRSLPEQQDRVSHPQFPTR
jgi:hypothetical protein